MISDRGMRLCFATEQEQATLTEHTGQLEAELVSETCKLVMIQEQLNQMDLLQNLFKHWSLSPI